MSYSAKTIGFLGCGNMGECILSGILKSGSFSAENAFICNRTQSRVKHLSDAYGVKGLSSAELAEACDIILIGVKPYGVGEALDGIEDKLTDGKLVISMAAGVSIDSMRKHVKDNTKVIRVMPNVPAFVGCGMTSISPSACVTHDELSFVVRLFETIGKACVVPESSIHGVIGVCGSSPAYVFMFIEALSDGAVRGGIPRQQAYEMAAQAVLGAAKMVQDTGKSPGELKDMVCSPGGTTIEAVRFLEKGGMRSAVIEAMVQCMEKSREMEKAFGN